MISDELYKRKGCHHRTSSCPTRIPQDQGPSMHPLEVSSRPPVETRSSKESLDQQDHLHSLVCSLLDPLLPRTSGELAKIGKTCSLCAAKNKQYYLRQSEVKGLGDQPVKDHTLVRDENVYAIKPSKIASVQESKLFFNALDLLDIRKELFLKVLEDPNSSVSHHLHNQRASTSRFGLTKSVSFPMPGSSGRGAPIVSNNSITKDINTHASTSSEGLRENSAMETGTSTDGEARNPPLPLLRNDSLDNASTKEIKKQNVNSIIMKRFKNLRAKIKHAIKEGKKERQRIVMDGFLHKIPYGYPKNVKEKSDTKNDIVAQNWCKYSPGDGSKNDQFPPVGNSKPDMMRRTASFNEPLSRYNRLVEMYFNIETENQTSDGSSLIKAAGGSPASMARILSLPDLRSHSFSRVERWPAANSLVLPMKPDFASERPSEEMGTNNLCNYNNLVAFKNNVTSGDSAGNDIRKTIHDFGEEPNGLSSSERRNSTDNPSSDILHDSKMEEDATGTGSAMSSTVEDGWDLEVAQELEPQADQDLQLMIPSEEDSSIGSQDQTNETETPERQSYINVQVELKNRAEFNYVRDVLDLSGFTRTEVLGKWHSEEQPVDPLVFNEVEGCLLSQPNCYGNEEGGSCNHLLLFDLINEVLLEIYEKTFSYWPKLLTCCSQVHPMPVGYHLLEDVWENINWYLQRSPEVDQSLDDAVSHDLSKSDGWMNVQFEAECVGIELEDWIFDDLLDELAFP